MNDTIQFMNSEGLKFFGRVNASISHELKNILAIISETSGFLNDLTELAGKGQELKLSLLGNCNESIAEEVQRGFDTIKQMNKFSHSVDDPIKTLDLGESLELAVKLISYLSTTGKVDLNLSAQAVPPVLTSPFLFQNLIYHTLVQVFETCGIEQTVTLDLSPRGTGGVCLKIIGPDKTAWENFPTPGIEKTAGVLGIELKHTSDLHTLELDIACESEQVTALASALAS